MRKLRLRGYAARHMSDSDLVFDVHHRRQPTECYPDDQRLANALETLAAAHDEASFLVPTGAVRAIDALRALVKGGRALVIAGDKG